MHNLKFPLMIFYVVCVSVFLMALVECTHLHDFGLKFAKEGLTYRFMREIITSVALLLGIFSKHAFDRLSEAESKKKRIRLRSFFGGLCHDPGFYKAALIAPIVYYVTYLGTDATIERGVVASVYLSYVNGFFWKTVLGKAQTTMTGTDTKNRDE